MQVFHLNYSVFVVSVFNIPYLFIFVNTIVFICLIFVNTSVYIYY